jgi:hypothetical protein
MNQDKLAWPGPLSPATAMLADAEYESWLSEAPDFTIPGEPGFAQALDALPPGPLLVALTDEGIATLSRLSDDELAAVMRATERLIAYARYQQFLVVSELARRGLVGSLDAAP